MTPTPPSDGQPMSRRVIAARAIIREAIRLVGLDTTAELLLAEATVAGRLKHHA